MKAIPHALVTYAMNSRKIMQYIASQNCHYD